MSDDPIAVIRRVGLLPIARGLPADALAAAADVLLAEEVPLLEVTMNTAEAGVAIRRVSEAYEGRLVVGAGTVLEAGQAEQAVAAGAQFLVTPHVDTAVAAAARRLRVPLIAGALTPTEILAARRAGAALVKLFPAVTVGPQYLRQLRGPLPEIPLVPTGGITVESTAEFMAAGAVAVGVGGSLLGGRAKDLGWLRSEVVKFKDAVARGRPSGA